MKNVLHDKAREVLYRSNNITVFSFNGVPIIMMDYPDRYLHASTIDDEQLEKIFNNIKIFVKENNNGY